MPCSNTYILQLLLIYKGGLMLSQPTIIHPAKTNAGRVATSAARLVCPTPPNKQIGGLEEHLAGETGAPPYLLTARMEKKDGEPGTNPCNPLSPLSNPVKTKSPRTAWLGMMIMLFSGVYPAVDTSIGMR